MGGVWGEFGTNGTVWTGPPSVQVPNPPRYLGNPDDLSHVADLKVARSSRAGRARDFGDAPVGYDRGVFRWGSGSVSACSRRLPIGRSALCLEKSASAGVEPRCYCAASAAAFSVEGLQPLG